MPEGSGTAAVSTAAIASQALTRQTTQMQSSIPEPPWRHTRQRSQSHSFTAATAHSEPQSRLTAAQWSAYLTTSLNTPRPSRTLSPPPARNAQRYFYHPPTSNRYIPDPGERSLPTFDGSPRSLQWFLDEIELLGRECHLSSQDQILLALYCVNPRDREIWREVTLESAGSSLRFKNKIMAMFPGSGQRYTARELEILVKNQAIVPMIDLAQFGEYLRSFVTKADWLVAYNEICQRERVELFLEGFHADFRNQIKAQLRLANPMHPFSRPWSVEEVQRAATFLLENIISPDRVQPSYPIYYHPPSPLSFPTYAAPTQADQPPLPFQPPQPSNLTPGPSAPHQTFDISDTKQFPAVAAAELKGEVKSIFEQNMVPTHTQQTRPSFNQYHPGCRACSDTNHVIRFCPKVVEYIRQGRCIKDQSNRICLPNRIFVSRYLAPGKDILERVDNWHKAHSTSTTQLN